MRFVAIAIVVLGVVTSPHSARAGDVISGAGAAHASVLTSEHLTVAAERDFSGAYAVATWVADDTAMTLYLDCVWVQPGTSPGTGDLTASGIVVGGSLPLLRSITVRIDATAAGARFGVVEGVRGVGATCGRDRVPLRAATVGAVVSAAA